MMTSADAFDGVTVFILAYNETGTLREVVDSVCDTCEAEDIRQILLVIKNDRCPSYFYASEMLKEKKYSKVRIYLQRSENIISCFSELPALAQGTHFIIMASDMEMDPRSVSEMIKEAKKSPKAIICASKWENNSVVEGYGFLHRLGTVTMNRLISLIVARSASDPVSVFEIFPVSVYNEMRYSGDDKFMFEYNIKPLVRGVEYREIPTLYRKNRERRSNFSVLTLFAVAVKYIVTAVIFRLKG